MRKNTNNKIINRFLRKETDRINSEIDQYARANGLPPGNAIDKIIEQHRNRKQFNDIVKCH